MDKGAWFSAGSLFSPTTSRGHLVHLVSDPLDVRKKVKVFTKWGKFVLDCIVACEIGKKDII